LTEKLFKILYQVKGKALGILPDTIGEIKIDSRLVKPGDMFVAIKGAQTDGHHFLHEAIRNGAAMVVVEEPQLGMPVPQLLVTDTKVVLSKLAANYYGNPTQTLKVVGVTGTNGKTTTVFLLDAILRAAGIRRGTIGTLGYSINDAQNLSNLTTPDCLHLNQILAAMLTQRIEIVAMEVSSHALALSRVADVNFYAAALTNISQDHLDFHQTIDNYAATKARLFAIVNPAGFLVCNLDDHYASLFMSAAVAPVFTYAEVGTADYCWLPGVIYQSGIRGIVHTPRGEFEITCRLSGRHNLKNILGVVAIAQNLGIESTAIQQGLAAVSNVPGRLEEITQPGKPRVFVDYAHTPDAIRNVLSALQPLKKSAGRLLVVFGCGGNRDRSKRPLMAQAVSEQADLAILTSDNPRFESPEEIIAEAAAGFPRDFNYITLVDRREAIQQALTLGTPQDIIAILGKGHESYQEIRGQRLPFSDRQVVLEFWGVKNA
jgi:UDP-N-acetylmuramoyl-L-alanyl-D-glutamate--2,6-diaminopimelate ligase